MFRIIFCCFFIILTIDNSLAVPTSLVKTSEVARDNFSVNLYSRDHELIKNIAHEYLGYIRNYLSSIRGIAKAVEKVLEEEFHVRKLQSSESSMVTLIKNVYDSCIYIQQFTNATESMISPALFGYSKQYSEFYTYKRTYYGIKSTISTLREVAAEIVKSYRYFVPEVTFTRCMGTYVIQTYPEWVLTSLAAFPITFVEYGYDIVNDFVKIFQNTNLEVEHKNTIAEIGTTSSVQSLLTPQIVWAFEQLFSDSNEISQNGNNWEFRELNSQLSHLGRNLLQLFNFNEITADIFGGAAETPMKCIQQYALQFLWNRADLILSR